MLPPNTILFISDLHLSAYRPAGLSLFLQFLEGPALQAEQLYILGDLFDVWIGKDLHVDFQTRVQQALKSLAQRGIAVFFMCGNRDFLITRSFLKEANCQKLFDPCLISLHGIPTLLTHGDQLCTDDLAYQRYRYIAQHPITRFLFLRLPKSIRESIGNRLRAKSQQYQKNQTHSILDVTPSAVEKWMIHHSVKQLIHGHVHKPKIHDVHFLGKRAKRVVLGDWHETASMIVSTPNKTSLASFCPSNGISYQESYSVNFLI